MTKWFVMTGGRTADEVMDRAGAHGSPVRAVADRAPSGAVYGAVEILGDEGVGVQRSAERTAPAPGEPRASRRAVSALPFVDDFLCVLCGALIRSDPDAPPDTTWFDTFDDGKPYHAACWDLGRRQIVLLAIVGCPELWP